MLVLLPMFVESIFGFGICGHLSRYHTCATPSCLPTLQRKTEKVIFRWEWNSFTWNFQNEHKGQALVFWPKTVRLFASLPCFEAAWIIHPCWDADDLFSPMVLQQSERYCQQIIFTYLFRNIIALPWTCLPSFKSSLCLLKGHFLSIPSLSF